MNFVIASGKGGTGKTTFAVNLAYTLAYQGDRVRLLDCDVEEPNDFLFVRPELTEKRSVEVLKPAWDEDLCTGCGKCAEACVYNAIAVVKNKVLIFNELCHSCGVCTHICPEEAFTEKPVEIGIIEAAPHHQPFFFAHGILNIGEAMAPAVIRNVKKFIDPEAVNIIDASPGTSCPVVETLDGADVAVLVTEPTMFGLNDLKLALDLALERKIPACIVINRSDGKDSIIMEYAEQAGVPVVGRIPYKREYAEAYSEGAILVERFTELKENLLRIFDGISRLIGTFPPELSERSNFFVETESQEPFSSGVSNTFREITVISGKGGSGKTTIVAALATLTENKVLADNDVDAADLHLLLAPTAREVHDFVGGRKASIDPSKCTGCGLCEAACHFHAIHSNGLVVKPNLSVRCVDELTCEGCGLCEHICEADAVTYKPNTVGKWFVSGTDYGPMAHAQLGIAEENSGRLVTQVRTAAAGIARDSHRGLILGDGPPGTGCPVIASISGADRVLIVTEPTVSGVHDMQRVLQLAGHFGIPAFIVINKADLNMRQAERIEAIAAEMGSSVIARIPYDYHVNDALMAGQTIIQYGKGPAVQAVLNLWDQLQNGI